MPDTNQLEAYYRGLSDGELLELGGQEGFTREAKQTLSTELARRKISNADIRRHSAQVKRAELRDEVEERGGGYRSLGLRFFGSSYRDEADRRANIQTRTKWITMSGIPLIPLASYRLQCSVAPGKDRRVNPEQVIERVQLDWEQVALVWAKTALAMMGAVLLIAGVSWVLASTTN